MGILVKLRHYKRRLSKEDFIRKLFHYGLGSMSRLNFLRRFRAWFFFKSSSLSLGKHIRIYGLPYRIKVGRRCQFYDNCIFEFGDDCDVAIGSNVVLSYGVVLSSRVHISIGNDVQIGEYSSIRDSTHRYDSFDKPMKYQLDRCSAISIADNVWIGRGCLIMPGSEIEEGVVVAAHSVVKGKLARNGIYGGKPATFIKSRLSE